MEVTMVLTLDLPLELEHQLAEQAAVQQLPLSQFVEKILTKTLNFERVELIRQLGHHHTMYEAIRHALEFYLQYLQQQAILTEFGNISYSDSYNYKQQRALV
jgi:hypothetical protein